MSLSSQAFLITIAMSCLLYSVSGSCGKQTEASLLEKAKEWTVGKLWTPYPAENDEGSSSTHLEKATQKTLGQCPSSEPCTEKDDSSSATTYEAVKKLAGTAAAALTGSAATSTLGTVAGFTAGGIVKGSIAASMQSYIGTTVVFSTLQSLGATGGMAMLGPVGLAGGAVAGVGYFFLG